MGNLRAALFNWLFCKKAGGRLVLRMEDTDKVRSTKEAEAGILHDLSWIGIDFDEGPGIGGDYSPYRQSERTSTYKEYVEELLKNEKAYLCFCSKEELLKERKNQIRRSRMPAYSGKCRNLTEEDRDEFVKEGRKPVVRLLIEDKTVTFNDLVKGEISYKTDSLGGDFIIRRSNGEFVYNFTVVIDDALMKISHVIRGEDHLTNTIKQLLLYEAFGFTPPEFAHCPLILGDDGKKLSKRVSEEALSLFKKDGIIPDAIMNYTALLGWSSKDGTEIFKHYELIKRFDLSNVSKSPSIFNYNKLRWVNGEHIKLLDDAGFSEMLFDFLRDQYDKEIKKEYSIDLSEIDSKRFHEFSRLIKESVVILKDTYQYLGMFFSETLTPSFEAAKTLKQSGAMDIVNWFLCRLKKEDYLDNNAYKRITDDIKNNLNVKGKALFMPLRAAISGETKGPHLDELCTFLGRDAVIRRINELNL
jgi:glutamyl-tRNA synthetase